MSILFYIKHNVLKRMQLIDDVSKVSIAECYKTLGMSRHFLVGLVSSHGGVKMGR